MSDRDKLNRLKKRVKRLEDLLERAVSGTDSGAGVEFREEMAAARAEVARLRGIFITLQSRKNHYGLWSVPAVKEAIAEALGA